MLLLQAQAGGAGLFSSPIVMLALMFIIMWFFMIRPQRKQQKAIEAAARADGLPCLEKGYIRVVLEFSECSCCNG